MDISTDWVARQFGSVELGDRRLTKRLATMAAQIVRQTDASLPTQCGGIGSALTAAYRFLGNPAATPAAVQSAHRHAVLEECRRHPVILCVQDTTELDYTGRAVTGLGKVGDGRGQGFEEHTALAVVPGGGVLGILHQDIHRRHECAPGETLRQRQARWTEAMVWADTARALALLPCGATQIVHICDRAADNFDFLHTCRGLGQHYVVRAKSDRKAQKDQRLWSWLEGQPPACTEALLVPERPVRYGPARLTVRFAPITVPRPSITRATNPARRTRSGRCTSWKNTRPPASRPWGGCC